METRNVKITLETAKRWYEQGGEFKEMALSAFTEAELNPIRNEWESKFIGKEIVGVYIAPDSCIYKMDGICHYSEKGTYKTEKQAKSALAYAQLTQLMALPEYNGDWVPDWNDDNAKFVIRRFGNEIDLIHYLSPYHPISFKTAKIRDKFLENNLYLLKEYFELD